MQNDLAVIAFKVGTCGRKDGKRLVYGILIFFAVRRQARPPRAFRSNSATQIELQLLDALGNRSVRNAQHVCGALKIAVSRGNRKDANRVQIDAAGQGILMC